MKKIENLVKKYELYLKDEGFSMKSKPTKTDYQWMVENKEEIKKYLREEKERKAKEAQERQNKINAIEGLEELEKAIAEWENYHYQNQKRFDSEARSSFGIEKPKVNVEELKVKYARANAYLIAEAWKYASNYAKSSAGKKAIEKIINGEDYKKVIGDMEKEWEASINIWN